MSIALLEKPLLVTTAETPSGATKVCLGALLEDALETARCATLLPFVGTPRQRVAATVATGEVVRTLEDLTSDLVRTAWVTDRHPPFAEQLEAYIACARPLLAALSPGRMCAGSDSGPSWQRCATALGAAHDLVDTHFDHDGGWRSPDAAILSSESNCLQLLHFLAALALEAIPAAVSMLGVWAHPSHEVPILQFGDDLINVVDKRPELAPQIWNIGVAYPAVIPALGAQGVTVVARRLRVHCWRQLDRPAASASTLSDIATAGALLAGYANASPRVRNGWNRLAVHLRAMRTAIPPDAAVRAEVARVQDLLTEELDSRDVDLIIQTLSDIARWFSRAFDRLVRSGQLYIDARSLSGTELTDEPLLARAHLAGTIVAPPHERIEAIRTACLAVCGITAA